MGRSQTYQPQTEGPLALEALSADLKHRQQILLGS